MMGEQPSERGYTDLPEPAQRAMDEFCRQFPRHGSSGPITVAWAPGRANLIGEHTDYNDGYVLPVAVDRVVALAGRVRRGSLTRCYSVHHARYATIASTPAALPGDAPDTPAAATRRDPLWPRYIRGVLAELAALPDTPLTPAFAAAIAGDVPVGGGLSS